MVQQATNAFRASHATESQFNFSAPRTGDSIRSIYSWIASLFKAEFSLFLTKLKRPEDGGQYKILFTLGLLVCLERSFLYSLMN